MLVKNNGITEGIIIWIGKPFYAIDNAVLENRFMCIIDIDNKNNLYLLPMSTFKDKDKNKILSLEVNFNYSKIHGNTQDGYIKCNQVYVLKLEDINKFNEIKIKHEINDNCFNELINHIFLLKETNKIYKKRIKFVNFKENIIIKELKKENPN